MDINRKRVYFWKFNSEEFKWSAGNSSSRIIISFKIE